MHSATKFQTLWHWLLTQHNAFLHVSAFHFYHTVMGLIHKLSLHCQENFHNLQLAPTYQQHLPKQTWLGWFSYPLSVLIDHLLPCYSWEGWILLMQVQGGSPWVSTSATNLVDHMPALFFLFWHKCCNIQVGLMHCRAHWSIFEMFFFLHVAHSSLAVFALHSFWSDIGMSSWNYLRNLSQRHFLQPQNSHPFHPSLAHLVSSHSLCLSVIPSWLLGTVQKI